MIWCRVEPSRIEMSALGGSDRKLFLPSLQNGTKSAVLMVPAMRCGRSEKNVVTELTSSSVSILVALSKRILFEVCTKRKSACGTVLASGAAPPSLAPTKAAANAGAAVKRTRRVFILEIPSEKKSPGKRGISVLRGIAWPWAEACKTMGSLQYRPE